MADILSATSLVVAILAAFLSMWQADVNAALDLEPERDPSNRGPQVAQVARMLRRTWALAAISWSALVVLLPRSLTVLVSTARCAYDPTERLRCSYDDVQGMYVVVYFVLLTLAVILARQVWKLVGKATALK